MLPRGRSIFRMANGCSLPIRGPTSRTGRMSTWEPGRKAEAPPRSTVKPPLTRPTMEPVTGWPSPNTTSRRVQASSRRAFSRLITASPEAFSTRSRNTSTVSPTLGTGLPSPVWNSFTEMRPSVLRPTSTIRKSFFLADHVADHDAAFVQVAPGEALVEQRCEIVAGRGEAHIVSHGDSGRRRGDGRRVARSAPGAGWV